MGNSVEQYRALSFWHATVDDDLTPRTSVRGDLDTDVAIIGAGLTGLWTAYYLLEADPSLRVVLLEKHVAGFGASGRNGGWCSALFPASTVALERRHGLERALAMRRAMIDTVDEVGRVAAKEGIDCDFVRGGTISFARSAAQRVAARAEIEEASRYGVDQIELRADGGTFDPACARLHPAKLVRKLARVVERRGAEIYERTEVTDFAPHAVTTDRGRVTARHVLVATEGYGATMRRTHRTVLPLYSLMIATEPFSDDVWDEIGIAHGQTFADFRHLLVYGQRTADNRFAFGGRGARYHWGSAIRDSYDRSPAVFDHLRSALEHMFPALGPVRTTHEWGGPLGVPRDWHASVRFDHTTGIASAGGYVGDGLSTTNLAGRTLADLITGRETELTSLPWVNHPSPLWEREPLRFVGANLGLIGTAFADVEERVTKRRSLAARLIGGLTGH